MDTFRERMPLSRFLRQCLETVEKWSKQYANNDKVFILTPTIELQQWTKAYQWAKGNKAVTSKIFEDKTEFYCPSKKEIRAKEEDIKQVKGMIWNTFEQFKKRASAIWIITLPNHENMADNWKQGKCTCPYFLKKYMCKHLVGLAIRLKYVKPPPVAKDIPIGQRRKRGRPKKSSRALIVD